MRATIAAARIALYLCLCGPVAVPALMGQTGTGRLGLDSNAAPYGTPRDYTIAATEVRGLSTLDEKGLITRSGLEPGKVISLPGDATANAIKNLWKLKLFSDISISIERVVGDQVFLVIETRELPRVSKFSIAGVKKGESDDLRERIALIRGTPYKDHVRQNILNQVQSYYGDKGYIKAGAQVIERADTLGSNNIILDIVVDKGPKVRIDRIYIEGNEALDDGAVRRKMKDTKEKFRFDPFTPRDSLWQASELIKPSNIARALTNLSIASGRSLTEDRFQLNFFSSSKFQETTYEVDKNLIIQHYNTKGYRDARIASDSVYFSDENNLSIRLKVEEGPRYHFRHITWSGNSKYSGRQKAGDPPGRLDSVLTIQRGDLYNAERLEQKLQFDPNGQDVTSLYMDDGYLFFGVTPVEVRVENDSIDLEIRVSEGPQAIVRSVIIRGNTRTNEHVIRREIRSRPGDKFSRNDLIRTQREIAALGYFDPQQIGMNPIPNPTDGTVDLEFTVVEKPSDQLELSAGWGGVGRGVVGSVGVSFNNFSIQNMFKREAWKPLPQGDGQRLSFRVNSNGRLFQSYNMSFTEPWLGGKKPNSFTVSLFRTLLSNNLARNAEGRRSFATDGGTLAYGIRLPWPDDFFSLLVAISIQHYTLKDWTQSNFFLQNGSLYNLSTNFTLARNSAGPNPFFPQQGSNLALTLGVTPPYSAFSDKNYGLLPPDQRFRLIEYHKWRFNAEWFTPLMGKFVLRSSAKLGFIGFYNPAIGHSSFEQFQLGGDGLANFNLEGFDVIALRGYQPFQNANGATINSPIFNKFSLEMRYPISLNPSSTVYAHLFAEGGNLYTNIDQYNPFELRRAVGFGVRAFLPMFGLLGIDYGIRFDDGPTEPLLRTGNVFDYILNNGRFNIILGFEPE
jgi:outer membrane protein insertion porin family